MRIFFLSNQNSCRSQMAESILRRYDRSLEIYSAGINPVDHISPVAIEVLEEIGIILEPHVPHVYTDFEDLEFDYLITVGDGTNEELKIPPIKYIRKMHLGIHNPYKRFKTREELKEKCREIRDEIQSELAYFYYNIIEKQ